MREPNEFQHNCRPIDPKGEEDRRWYCIDCGRQGTLRELLVQRCIEPESIDYEARLIEAIEESTQ